jgi:tryptophan halogenase
MSKAHIKRIVIVGGGTAGWMAAAALVKLMGKLIEIELVESDEIGIVGVGEATIPQIKIYNGVLGLDENDFVARTQGTFKLGIQFHDWTRLGHTYIHTFGENGVNLGQIPFHHYWLRGRAEGIAPDLWAYSFNAQAAARERFARTSIQVGSRATALAYAFHFDASLYAKYLRAYAEQRGVKRTEGKIVAVDLHPESGYIDGVRLERGETIKGDLFIDCSGFRGLLIGGALNVGYEDWSKWLPVNRAFAVPTRNTRPARPYTQSLAHKAGWQWRIPLQHRTGNGHVFCNDYMSEDEAASILLGNLEGEPLAAPRLIKFTTGRRDKFWHKNCVALGLASGFLEPLESTSIHLIQSGVSRLIQLFPRGAVQDAEVDEYNRQCGLEFARIRDFIILHYIANERIDSQFWIDRRNTVLPPELAHKLDVFRAVGGIFREQEDLFADTSWLQVMIGQGVEPGDYHPMAHQISAEELRGFLGDIATVISKAVDALPAHEDFVAAHCAAPH